MKPGNKIAFKLLGYVAENDNKMIMLIYVISFFFVSLCLNKHPAKAVSS